MVAAALITRNSVLLPSPDIDRMLRSNGVDPSIQVSGSVQLSGNPRASISSNFSADSGAGSKQASTNPHLKIHCLAQSTNRMGIPAIQIRGPNIRQSG